MQNGQLTEKGMVPLGDTALALRELEAHFALAVRQRELLEEYISNRLKADKHFYIVGATEDQEGRPRKPALTKEGAEIICLAHALKPRYEILSGPENPPADDAPYQLTMLCELLTGDKRFGGQGIGSASSMITKKDGKRVARQRDPGLRHNATLKMAAKSAYIAATLNATAASEFFTQDLEDDTSQPSGATEAPSKEHWCEKHQTHWFKRGRMASYAHPLDDGKWCSEPAARPPAQAPQAQPSAPGAVSTSGMSMVDAKVKLIRDNLTQAGYSEQTIATWLETEFKVDSFEQLQEDSKKLNEAYGLSIMVRDKVKGDEIVPPTKEELGYSEPE